jgi:lactate dehydrogenase-like 2-hydroxyacid dehydrogenase
MQLIQQESDAEIWSDELPPPYEILLEKVRGTGGLVSLLTDRIDAGLMDAAGSTLKVISQMAVGYDNIDVAAATARGIPVGNTPGVLTETTADFAFCLLMAAARRVVEAERYVKAGAWKTWGPTLLMGYDVHGATLGLVGFGRIGQAMARRAGGFDMRILYHDPAADPAEAKRLNAHSRSLEELLAESDFVSLHVPLTPETHHLIGERQLRQMKPTAVLINTARGPVVDPRSLYESLRQRTIAAAALDVTDPEPIPPDDPLLSLENCLIVPHIASSSHATRTRMATMAADNLAAGLRGERLPHCVNPEAYR